MYELGGRRHLGKIGVEVTDASRKNSTSMRDSKGSFAFYKTESKAFLCSDRYSNLFLNAYINRHAHNEYLKII